MGTRAVINIKDDAKDSNTIVSIYTQFDGYPSGIGKDIKTIGNMEIINGISGQKSKTHANGMGCYAAQLISMLKSEVGIGTIYIVPVDQREEYNYTIWNEDGVVYIECEYYNGMLYSGPLVDFDTSVDYIEGD